MTRHQKPDPKSTRESTLSPGRSQPLRKPASEAEVPSGPDVLKNGVPVLTFSTPVEGPPTLMVVENDGRHVKEEQSLVGHVVAGFDRKAVLELYGIDLRYAIHNPKSNRWERCLFSYALAATLEMLSADDEFPFVFEAAPSQGEVDWADLKARGQTTRPAAPLSVFLTQATPESLSAVVDDDRMRVRRSRPKGHPDGDTRSEGSIENE